ncbi:MAG TPA: histidine phosphatase family protein, partial [Candidatus Binataceae bacterium]|nr:histidine phosphatase family protein [Candidatus Binataceae bacterium]
SARLIIFLVRHAEPVPPGTESYEENERPLSEAGRAAALALAAELATHRPVALYSSPYPRARQTIEPLALQLGIAIETIDDLRERLLTAAPLKNWRDELRRAWEDFDFKLAGGESSREAQLRVLRVLNDLRARHAHGAIELASHGNLIALALNAMVPRVDFDFWESIPLPAVYRLEFVLGRWRVASGPSLL